MAKKKKKFETMMTWLQRIRWGLSLAAVITASADTGVFKTTLQSTLEMYINVFIKTILHMGTCRHREVKLLA